MGPRVRGDDSERVVVADHEIAFSRRDASEFFKQATLIG
jgi:hypothetical protein